jgi:hypothetical protein
MVCCLKFLKTNVSFRLRQVIFSYETLFTHQLKNIVKFVLKKTISCFLNSINVIVYCIYIYYTMPKGKNTDPETCTILINARFINLLECLCAVFLLRQVSGRQITSGFSF